MGNGNSRSLRDDKPKNAVMPRRRRLRYFNLSRVALSNSRSAFTLLKQKCFKGIKTATCTNRLAACGSFGVNEKERHLAISDSP